ncbi:MAG: type IV secretory system conjugative DNA transfer family protein [Solirubrobacterales bacterium]|nr:type IV secretory system conjugative DNA transfer family protein [Solirubrobacterales bacterium]
MNASRTDGVSDGVLLVMIGGLVAVGSLVWVWGGIAGALFGSGWPRLQPDQLLDILVRLPARLADPRRAWPAGAGRELPGPGGFYAALAVVACVATSALLLVRRAFGRARPASLRRAAGARWARSTELRTLRTRERTAPDAGGGRLSLGRHHGRVLRAEHRHALIAFGPPQSGKSAALAVPALLEWHGPAVASSIKTDLLATTLARRRRLGTSFIFDPFGLAGTASQTWSPLRAAGTWDGALEVAWRLAAAGELDQRGVEGGDFWAIAAEQRLAPLLYTAAATGATVDSVVRWAYGQGSRELDDALLALGNGARDERELADARAAYDAVRAFAAQADRTRSSIEATAQAILRAYRFARVARSATSCEITPERLLEEPATLYLIGDAKASKLLRPIFLALLGEVVDAAYERATRAGGQLELPLLLCLDEAGNVAPLPNLAEIASTAPSHNIQLISIFHDLQQARARYGKQAETVVNSHRARMLLPGVADLETLRYFAGLLGEEEAAEQTRTTGPGGTSRSSGVRRRPLASAEALRQLRDGRALLLYGRLPPAELILRLWFRERRLRRLARV